MKTTLKFAAVAAALAGALGNAQALPVAPASGPVALPAAGPADALGTLLDSIATPITTPTFTGTARAEVYDGPEAGVNLNFFYQFSTTGGSDSIARLSAGGFTDWTTDVFQNTGGFGSFVNGTVAGSTVDRLAGTVGFNFGPTGIGNGQSSNVLEIRTDATAYVSHWMGVLDATGGFAPAFAPAIPEPETYALLLAGLGLLGVVGARRMRGGAAAAQTGKPALA